ncbi:MAG: helix-turn-helix domain-containing protein, partial [Candidatus Methylomirabilales bacterium]
LLQYDWPGNVRELENCIEHAAVMAEGPFIDIPHLRPVLRLGLADSPQQSARLSLREMEKALILDVLRQTRGNRRAAAAVLGISRRGLLYKLKRFNPNEIHNGDA